MQQRAQPTAVAIPVRERRDDAEMFDLAPVSLWLEDYSGVKVQFDAWRSAGVTSLRELPARGSWRGSRPAPALIRVIKVNPKTLSLFEAEDFVRLVANLDRVFRDDMLITPPRGACAALGRRARVFQQHRQLHACRAGGSISS